MHYHYMKRLIALFTLVLVVIQGSWATDRHNTKTSGQKFTQDSIDRIVTSLLARSKGKKAHYYFYQKQRDELKIVSRASLTIRKKFYRHIVYNVMPKIGTSWEYRRIGLHSFFHYFDNDYSHFHKYINKLEIGEIQRFFKYYNHTKCAESKYRALPLDVARLKEDDIRLYMIAHAQFNLLKSGRPLRKPRYPY